jgi:hypothetical protein
LANTWICLVLDWANTWIFGLLSIPLRRATAGCVHAQFSCSDIMIQYGTRLVNL